MKETTYRALALDLDGTLTDSEKRLSRTNKEAIWKAIDQGITVILASGRPTLGMTSLATELELEKRGGIILAFNGGRIFNCKSGEIIQSLLLPSEMIPDVCSISKKHGALPLSYDEKVIIAEDAENEYVLKEVKCNTAKVRQVEDLAKALDFPVVKLLVVGEHERLLKVQAEVLEKYSDIADSFFSESYFLEVVPKNVAKDKALARVCDYLHITSDQLMACGDGLNDIPMLKFAGLAVAMENAYPQAKEMADYISPSNDENGVAHAIEKFLLN